MSRIIIDNKSSLSDYEALKVVESVILEGLISTEKIQGETVAKYCHLSHYTNGGSKCVVWARPRKTKQSAYSFLLYDEEEMERA